MSREFLEIPGVYKAESAISNAYLCARAEWDERYMNLSAHAANWRRAFFLTSLLSFGLLLVSFYLGSLPRHVPIVISLDKQRGEPTVLGKGSERFSPDISLIEVKYFLMSFIQRVRSVPSDPVLVKKQWLEAYLFLRKGAANYLNSLTNQDESSPLKRIGQSTLTVQPISVTQVGKSNSYQARWRELVYTSSGALEEQYVMSGVFTVSVETPSDEKTILVNPLGIFIESFQWAKEL